ncbi:MAG TPA: inositol monophosphatase family protein [Polyangiales bacterium]
MSQADVGELRRMLPDLLSVAREAGELVMRGYRSPRSVVQKKGAIDLVTEYDLASERHIAERLAQLFPDIAIVGEEGHQKAARAGAEDALTFFVDPIDGTTNFAHGHPFFAISLGLCRAGQPLLGVLVAPALGVAWTGVVGGGAERNGEPCAVSTRAVLGDALCATGFGYSVVGAADENVDEFREVQRRVRGIRRCGAAALDLALVADGTYDAYWEFLLQPWDMAAGAALVLAAGGQVSAIDGGALDVRTGACLATNGALHAPLAALVASARGGRPVPVRPLAGDAVKG